MSTWPRFQSSNVVLSDRPSDVGTNKMPHNYKGTKGEENDCR